MAATVRCVGESCDAVKVTESIVHARRIYVLGESFDFSLIEINIDGGSGYCGMRWSIRSGMKR